MPYGTRIEDHKCAACHQTLTIPADYQNAEYYHSACWERAIAAFANAERIVREVNPNLFIHEGLTPE